MEIGAIGAIGATTGAVRKAIFGITLGATKPAFQILGSHEFTRVVPHGLIMYWP